jgi:hypothetical protein
LFTFELDRRTTAAGLPVTAVAAHPGYTKTNLVANGPTRGANPLVASISVAVTGLVGQGAEQGALPQLRAAVEPGLSGGAYVGPGGPFELHGAPRVVRPPRQAQDTELAAGLWALSETVTAVTFP